MNHFSKWMLNHSSAHCSYNECHGDIHNKRGFQESRIANHINGGHVPMSAIFSTQAVMHFKKIIRNELLLKLAIKRHSKLQFYAKSPISEAKRKPNEVILIEILLFKI